MIRFIYITYKIFKVHIFFYYENNLKHFKFEKFLKNLGDFKLKTLFFKEWKVTTLNTIRNRIRFLEAQKLRGLEILKYAYFLLFFFEKIFGSTVLA